MTRAESDYNNSDNPSATITGGVLVYEYVVDAEGYVLMHGGTIRNPRLGEVVGDESKSALDYPFDRGEIVWFKPGWPVDQHGRGLSVLEVQGTAALRLEERRTDQHIRQFLTAVAA